MDIQTRIFYLKPNKAELTTHHPCHARAHSEKSRNHKTDKKPADNEDYNTFTVKLFGIFKQVESFRRGCARFKIKNPSSLKSDRMTQVPLMVQAPIFLATSTLIDSDTVSEFVHLSHGYNTCEIRRSV